MLFEKEDALRVFRGFASALFVASCSRKDQTVHKYTKIKAFLNDAKKKHCSGYGLSVLFDSFNKNQNKKWFNKKESKTILSQIHKTKVIGADFLKKQKVILSKKDTVQLT